MDSSHLEDRIAWGRNRAARRIGQLTDAFRPSDPTNPLSPSNRYLRLHATFSASPGNFEHAPAFGNPFFFGHFDSSYTRVGDYLVQDDRTYFIASQESLMPVLCVRTNKTISILRPADSTSAGANPYSARLPMAATPQLTNWPASVLGVSTAGSPAGGLPSEMPLQQWTILLPHLPNTDIAPSDLVLNTDGRQAVVSAAEYSHMGWRIIARDTAA